MGRSTRRGSKSTAFAGAAAHRLDPDAREAPLETERAEALLIVTAGPLRGREFALAKPLTVIGRDPKVDVPIDDEAASRRHAAIVNQGSSFALRDLGSTNGTCFGKVIRSCERPLRDGDCFRIGETEFRFRDID